MTKNEVIQNKCSGAFALGSMAGVCLAIGIAFAWGECEPESSILWFCDESQAIVLGVLSYLKDTVVALAWPAVVLALAFLFRKEIVGLLPRIETIGKDGVRLKPMEQQRYPTYRPSVAELKINETLSDPKLKELKVIVDEIYFDDEPTTRDAKLRLALAQQALQKHFALTYSNIFGSQISALLSLNALSNGSIKRVDAEVEFEKLQAENPVFKNWTLSDYISYLVSNGLVLETEGAIQITETGRNFISFLVQNGLSFRRPN